jgi:DNA-binding LacI/PurR family transcriptional regulator
VLVKWTEPSDVAAVRGFLDHAQPDAIICANDYTAAQLLTTLNEIGVQVPSQIRVAGMDDVKYARLLQTPLTTIRQPCQDLGATALFAMLNRIANPTVPSRDFLLDFQLMVRKSTDPNAGAQPDTRSSYRDADEDTAGPNAAEVKATPVPLPEGPRSTRTDSF